MASLASKIITVASYNIHRCYGTDKYYDPARVGAVLQNLQADIIGLQEADSSLPAKEDLNQIAYLAQMTNLKAIQGPTILGQKGSYGNVLLTKYDIEAIRHIDLSLPGHEPRAAIDADLVCDGLPLRILVTHLGLSHIERYSQVVQLLLKIKAQKGRPTLLLGDLNEWRPRSRLLTLLRSYFGNSMALRTYPSRYPLFALDRIFMQPKTALLKTEVKIPPQYRRASDHLPLKAWIQLS